VTRAFLRIGDKTTSGGKVLQGIPNVRHDGLEITYIGACVYCPACGTTGYIIQDGAPRLPMNWMGKEPALNGDLCLCKCSSLPTILASQHRAVVSHDDRAKARQADASNLAASPAAPDSFDERFQLVDAATGAPLAGIAYRALSEGRTLLASGVCDRDGRTNRISTKRGETIQLQIKGGR
jgi:uncharacterized Zn-binding protein involved in type VI secretion